MIGPCIVWACPRPAQDASQTFCARHAPDSPWQDRDAEYDAAYLLAEGMTLAEVAALS